MKRFLKILLYSVLVLIVVLPFVNDKERIQLDDAYRKQTGSTFLETPDGFVHYQLGGNPDGEVVVFIHGFSMPLFIFEPLAKLLEKEGYRTLRIDLFGRGLSDRPDTTYDPDLFKRQILNTLDGLKIQSPVNLVGTSMGGIVVTRFALDEPKRVKRLVLIAPAGFPMDLPLIGKITRLPWVGEYLMKTLGDRTLLKGTKTSFYNMGKFPDFDRQFSEQMEIKGFKRAILSSLRNMKLESFLDEYKLLGGLKLPKLLIWGREDKVVPFSNSGLALEVLPDTVFFPLDALGHIPHYEAPEVVAKGLLAFLKKN
ncbi:alpha/beta hydrolase [Leptospira kobayashii]|uniref:Alpha/beta hydrolase n=1 Tax=Leptospira kobayashii TaxID=1917830 RepID=A0ABM7UH69_9LEPT|nr:alpha/beta hydrolase [Leptospira kobayashii]BDA77991.1 alpha/beta hydrolase [Leptospira kobayashii]